MNPTFIIEMENGQTMKGELYPETAPNSVANFVELANSGFYEQLSAWIEQNGRNRIYPDIGAGKRVVSFSCVTAGYLHSRDDSGHAKYQIQINLTYFEGGITK